MLNAYDRAVGRAGLPTVTRPGRTPRRSAKRRPSAGGPDATPSCGRNLGAERIFRRLPCWGLALLVSLGAACGRARPTPPTPPQPSKTSESVPPSPVFDPSAPSPQLEARVEPEVVVAGESVLLTWEARNADFVLIDHEIGPVLTEGRIKLFPEETTSYRVTAEGRGGTLDRLVTVEVRLTASDAEVGEEDKGPEQRFAAFIKPVYFDYASADLSEDARITLDGNIRWLLEPQNTMLRFEVQGRCDIRGSEEYSLALGDKRAQVVRAYLIRRGVEGRRVTAVSLGEERPLVAGDSEEAQALNRRAHFVLLLEE